MILGHYYSLFIRGRSYGPIALAANRIMTCDADYAEMNKSDLVEPVRP